MMEQVHLSSCPICKSKQVKYSFSVTDHLVSGSQFPLWQCDDCGFVFTQDRPDDSHLGGYYASEDYVSHSDTRRGLIASLYHIVRTYMLHNKASLVKKATRLSEGSLLDIGAGTGYFARTMKQQGWTVDAIEPEEKARAFARSKFGLDIHPNAHLDEFDERSFDVITLWHVLEHISALHEAWQTYRRLLRPGGKLIIAVPNRLSYDAAHYAGRWAAYDAPRHLWHFAPSDIRRLASLHGFTLDAVRPMPFDAFYISMLSEKNSGKNCAFLRGFAVGLRAWISLSSKRVNSSSLIYILTPVESPTV